MVKRKEACRLFFYTLIKKQRGLKWNSHKKDEKDVLVEKEVKGYGKGEQQSPYEDTQ